MRKPEFAARFESSDGRFVIAKIRAVDPNDFVSVVYEGDRSILKSAPSVESVLFFCQFVIPENEAAGLKVTFGEPCEYDNPDEVLA